MITLKWDSHALAQRDRFLSVSSEMETFMDKTAKDLAEYAKEYFKPMLNVRTNPAGNKDTANSIQSQVTVHGTDFTIEYTGLISALYMDEGNFDPGTVLNAQSKGLKFFPVDARFGESFRYNSGSIHGMGYRTPGVPTHWSDKTVEHLADDGVALDIAMKYFSEFLNGVVITE